MERLEVLSRLQGIFRDVLDNEEIVINEETTANDIEEWDSLTNVQLVVEIQKVFGKKFPAKEIIAWKSVGDIINAINI